MLMRVRFLCTYISCIIIVKMNIRRFMKLKLKIMLKIMLK
jgi:hypothetical protein